MEKKYGTSQKIIAGSCQPALSAIIMKVIIFEWNQVVLLRQPDFFCNFDMLL